MAAQQPCNDFSHVKENILALKKDIAKTAAAAAAAGAPVSPTVPTLVAVSKCNPPAAVSAAVGTGQLHFGENYVQELIDKSKQLPSELKWHFIGHLQTNKVKALLKEVPTLFSVDSVDSKKLAETLQKEAANNQRQLNVLVQVNAGEEAQKSGLLGQTWTKTQQEALSLATFITKECPALCFMGYMTVAPHDKERALATFERMRQLKELTLHTPEVAQAFANGEALELSMGMSADMDLAIANGSTQVRVGKQIFGARPPKPQAFGMHEN